MYEHPSRSTKDQDDETRRKRRGRTGGGRSQGWRTRLSKVPWNLLLSWLVSISVAVSALTTSTGRDSPPPGPSPVPCTQQGHDKPVVRMPSASERSPGPAQVRASTWPNIPPQVNSSLTSRDLCTPPTAWVRRPSVTTFILLVLF